MGFQSEEDNRLQITGEELLDLVPHLRSCHAEQCLPVDHFGMTHIQILHDPAQFLGIVLRNDQRNVQVFAGSNLKIPKKKILEIW